MKRVNGLRLFIGKVAAGALLATGMTLVPLGVAQACGCFAPPDPSVPVVQAGERIVFATDGGQVTAHIQIQYAGDAKDFGWLLPLPSLPKMELGSDELFTQLIAQTQPKYRLVYANNCGNRGGIGGGANAPTAGGAFNDSVDAGAYTPLVAQDSIGPYDYAVLKADRKDEMFQWLQDNRYFVPVGTDDVVAPYIHEGAYFLALKLKSGKSAGDLQPVVVRYASDLPMIPIVLTSVTAQPDMGIQVWMLGTGRAIPRNYFHTVLDDAAIDWANAGANYQDLVIRATKEAEGRHTFVTEFAGKSDVMKGVLDYGGRFGSESELARNADAVSFVGYLRDHGYGAQSAQGGFGGPGVPTGVVYSGALLGILQAHIPMPQALADQGVTAATYYSQLDYYLGAYRDQYPQQFAGLDFSLDGAAVAAEIWQRVVEPTQAASKLFDTHPYLTRLYTTLSPEQMNRDPVFSYNPDLPDVSNVHEATLTYQCNVLGDIIGSTLVTEQGHSIKGDGQSIAPPDPNLPASQRIEILREEGAPETVVDNAKPIRTALATGGCSVAPGSSAGSTGMGLAMLLIGAALGLRRRATR